MQSITRENKVNHDGKLNPSFFIALQETCSPKNKCRTLGSPAEIFLKNKYKEYINTFCKKHPNYFREYHKNYYKIYKNKINFRRRQLRKERKGNNNPMKENNNLTKEIKKDKYWRFRHRHPENRKRYKQLHRALRRNAGFLSIQTIQEIYEENIKQYGTLTCIYCQKPIVFGEDTLEHKIPLSRGGTNLRENLDIACRKCNLQKNSKTEIEYKKWKAQKC